jgi:hypothetical protein
VILLGLQKPQNLPFALFLLVFFSVGLGAVLVAIGVLLVAGKALASDRTGEGRFLEDLRPLQRVFAPGFLALLDRSFLKAIRVLPVLSALFIAALGAFFCAATLQTGGVELRALWSLIASR